ncbi:hypothetical protein Avbf_16083, partial [Armadillidium vulgare]
NTTTTTTTTTTVGLEEKISLHNNDKNNLNGYKNIAFWTGYSGKLQNWLSVFKRLVNKECEENRCNLIFNESELAMADAVVFNAVDLRKKSQFHSKTGSKLKIRDLDYSRREDQIFVLYTNEPPTWRKEEVGYVTEDELKAKNMAIWMVSHCRTPSKRSDFVGKLKRYLQWREDYDIDVGTPYKPLICDLCKKLHEQTPDR